MPIHRGHTHRKSDESIELKPLQKGSSTSKGVLRRMQRVKSDDLNADDEECPKDDKKEEKMISSPIGAGLPLLQRLRLLKEKQVRFDAFLNVLFIFILFIFFNCLMIFLSTYSLLPFFFLIIDFSHKSTTKQK